MNWRTEEQAEHLLDWLDANPGQSTWDITQHMREEYKWGVVGTPYLIWLLRNKLGDEVITCEYNYSRGVYEYQLARSIAEGSTYIARRVRIVRQIILNLIKMVDRLLVKFPKGANKSALYEARGRLTSAAEVLDNATEGGGE